MLLAGLGIAGSLTSFLGKSAEIKAQKKLAYKNLDQMREQAQASFGASGVSNPYAIQAIKQSRRDIGKAYGTLLRAEGMKDIFSGLTALMKVQPAGGYAKSLQDLFGKQFLKLKTPKTLSL